MGRSVLILLDTHVVLWLGGDHRRISPRAQKAIQEARAKEQGLAVSSMTLLEIARLATHGQIHIAPNLETFLSDVERRFTILPITSRIAVRAYSLPPGYPKDPADRVIGATALIEDLPLITADKEIRSSHAVSTIW